MEGSPPDHPRGDQGEETLNLIQPRTAGRGEMEVESVPLFRFEPALHLRTLVRAVVVHDEVYFLIRWEFFSR